VTKSPPYQVVGVILRSVLSIESDAFLAAIFDRLMKPFRRWRD